MSSILLIEDSLEFQQLVIRTLNQYNVTAVGNADEAFLILKKEVFDLIILDLHLPKKNGYSVMAELQSDGEFSQIPIVCLTGKSDVMDKVTAFSLGAEDYIVKPFDPIELRARIDAKLNRRKKNKEKSSRIIAGPLIIEPDSHRLFIQDKQKKVEVFLTQTEFKILIHLANKINRIFSRDQLLITAWGEDARVFDRVVDTHVCSLRKKLGSYGKMIKSVHGTGYKLVLPYSAINKRQAG